MPLPLPLPIDPSPSTLPSLPHPHLLLPSPPPSLPRRSSFLYDPASDDLTPSQVYTSRRDIEEWVLASIPAHRSTYTISTQPTSTLTWGLKYLRSRISSLVALDVQLYFEYASLLPPTDYTAQGFAYAGWCWNPPADEAVDRLGREQLIRYLWGDVVVYDEVGLSVRGWMRELERRRRREREREAEETY
ncbi:hypothetical protein K505DRAFT_324108 [Melanomma pulvis-pyrius CBS 109.77]|uniref:Uncharacterized protein n=1 Tax=Melanomma pulvis-pyrius CBS 109.77 TaxID=1314802 RepID=A0A6A6XGZ1_9PLEO|nr:hypothetical protein K505DRAFT_324108 [Melanomma pulvis-pyrius CBS 109.77]